MVTAAVGFQCPECASAGARRSQTIDVTAQRSRRIVPTVTMVLIAVNVAVFVIESMVDRNLAATGVAGSFFERFALFTPFIGGARGGLEWYRLISGGFMHAGLIHIGFNMWALYALGPTLETLIGRARFALLYAASLLGGGLGVVVGYTAGQGATVGASGAIFGLFGAYAVLELSAGLNPLRSGIGITILLNLLLTFTIPGLSVGGHVGGLLTGGVAGAVLLLGTPLGRQKESEQIGRGAAVVALGLACGAIAVMVAKSRYGLA